jgi:hypothetical protein
MKIFGEKTPRLSEVVQGQCYALRGLNDFQNHIKLNGTKYVGFNDGRQEQRAWRKGEPRVEVFNATSGGSHTNYQPSGQNVTPDLSERNSEGICFKNGNTFNSPNAFRVAGNPVEGFVCRRSCSWVEELFCLCRMLKFMCKNAMSLQPSTYRELVMLAETRPVHARQCYRLAQLIIFLSEFSSQMMSVLENLMKTLAVLNVPDFEPRQLISAVRKVASAFPLLDKEVEGVCWNHLRRASSEETPVQGTAPKRAQQTGTHWQLLAASQQLDIAGEHLEMASQLLKKFPQHNEGCSLDSSKCPIHSETYFQTACPKEKFMVLALKFSSIEKKILLLMEVVKHSDYRE